ncbi:MAG: histidine phosphatase family protein [Pseudomonadota bacterium]|nr:histidine phosphatase family protein [Pseudomonadota bacterium]
MGELILLRHGQSVWNKENLFTGWVNIGLSEQGIQEALAAGNEIQNTALDYVFVSSLIRAQQTAMLALANYPRHATLIPQNKENSAWQDSDNSELLPVYEDWRLNERYYGDLQGLNKQETIDKYGKEQVHIWRRSFDTPPPNGESLAMTAARTLPQFKENILPKLAEDKNILIVAHGNSLRSIIMEIEGLSASEITAHEIPTGKPIFYKYLKGKFQKN